MKISKIHTLWIIVLSVFFTADTCIRAILMRFLGRANRSWVDATIQNWVNNLLKLAKIKCEVFNPYDVKPQLGKATIIMCNHSSLYDIPISYKTFPNHSMRMLAKKELSKIPIMGNGMTAAEFLFIDRKNRHQAMKDLVAVRKLLESGIIMWIAPEGTRSKNGKLAPFKKGAFITAIEANATIIPVGIRGAYEILPARTMQFNINQKAEIHIGKPVDASQYSLTTRDDLVKIVHDSIKQLVED